MHGAGVGLKHHVLKGCEQKEGYCWLEGSQEDVGSAEQKAPADSVIPV